MRIVKFCEIIIMLVGGIGLVLAWLGFAVHLIAIPLMMLALFAMGIHSTFFGPIKYAILPQHLKSDQVLAGTGLVEAGPHIAIGSAARREKGGQDGCCHGADDSFK